MIEKRQAWQTEPDAKGSYLVSCGYQLPSAHLNPEHMLVCVTGFWLSNIHTKYLGCFFEEAWFLMLTITTSVAKNGLLNNNNSHIKHECLGVVNILI